MWIPIEDNGKKGFTLVHAATGVPVQPREVLTDFRGDKAGKVTQFQPPPAPGKSAHILVKPSHAVFENLYYSSVCNLKVIEGNLV